MNRYDGPLSQEDYEEPRCLLNMDRPGEECHRKTIDMRRVMEKLDEYQARKDYAGAERHLEFWLGEARLGNDLRGEFAVRGEQIGFYRKRGEEEKCFACVKEALRLMKELGYEEGISGATCWVNCGTAAQAFGHYGQAMEWFEKARAIYEKDLDGADARLGGLYNNMALTLVSEGRFEAARQCYEKALDVMEQVPGGAPERAITLLNLANAAESELGIEAAEGQIEELLDKAEWLLDSCDPREHAELADHIAPGYYAFVLESCAPTFSYYGYFLAAKKFSERAEEITKELS